MNELFDQEAKIQDEVDALRPQFTHTRDLYREVCALLFFRYGITPTTNKLYQLVKKGSMSVPTEVLSAFWKELREKSRVQITQPDLPEELARLAGEVMANLWTKALQAANESLSSYRTEIEAKLNAQLALNEALVHDKQALSLKLRDTEIALNNQVQKYHEVKALSVDLAKEKLALDERLTQSQLEKQTLLQSLDSLGLEMANEKTMRLDREEELTALRSAFAQQQEQHKNELYLLNVANSQLRENAGKILGQLQVFEQLHTQLTAELIEKEHTLQQLKQKLAAVVLKPKWQTTLQQKIRRR
jgi:hypothetical protein